MKSICSVSGCGKTEAAKGLCPMHYARVSKYGSVDGTARQAPELLFFSKIDKRESGCWEWTSTLNVKGYGTFKSTKFKTRMAHRSSYEITNGMGSADGHLVCHKCDNPKCVNPDHLFIGTQKENVADMYSKGRQPKFLNRKGESQNMAKLKEQDVLAIRGEYQSGTPSKQLAHTFNVSLSTIHTVVSRRTWTHI